LLYIVLYQLKTRSTNGQLSRFPVHLRAHFFKHFFIWQGALVGLDGGLTFGNYYRWSSRLVVGTRGKVPEIDETQEETGDCVVSENKRLVNYNAERIYFRDSFAVQVQVNTWGAL
ncbi:hypothetical protein ACJX0J_025992, partial [Zea mays]